MVEAPSEMSWQEHATHLDDDSKVLVDIAVTFLGMYFHHSRPDAARLMSAFLIRNRTRHGNDYFQYEGPYRAAATVHFVEALAGNPNDALAWLRSTGHNNPPHAAVKYFHDHYFIKP